MLKALIFDFDGLMIDTEICDYKAWLEIYHEYGLDYPINEWQKLIGTYTEVPIPLDRLDKLKGPIDREKINTQRLLRSTELASGQDLLPGVMDYLNTARNLGLMIAIASSSPRVWLDRFLEPRKLTHLFNTIVTGDLVSQVKPNPELFITAINKLGIEPHEALILEDSVNGLKAATSAGIRCVIIPSTLTHGMDFHEADLILETLHDYPLNNLLEYFNGK